MAIFQRFKNIGPGAFVTAAFIGPGTITACTLAGASFGYALLWALVFATFATIILQEMTARLGIVTGKGLGEVIREIFAVSLWRWPLFALIIVAMYVGNAAYEAGNLSGAALGLQALFGESDTVFQTSIAVISALASLLLYFGSFKLIERLLITLVMVMAAAFITTFIMVQPDYGAFFSGLLAPTIPDGSLLIVIALIGTTVVPYNLFLHASSAKKRWQSENDLSDARFDTVTSIGLGGIITIVVVSTAATSALAGGEKIQSAVDMARQIEPLFGVFSKYLFGIGFFAAGLSSAISAPLATGYVVSEISGMNTDTSDLKFRLVMLSVVVIGATVALTGLKPITIIISAQFSNGLVLPIIAGFLLFAMNRKALLKAHVNSVLANILGGAIVLVMLGLGTRLVLRSFGLL